MMMLKLLAKEVHQNAVAHGFYDGGAPDFTEILADCHSELSEAREEQRSGKPMEYKREDGKPCGVAVEMVDCMLRILDWFGHNGLDVDRILIEKHAYNRTRPYLHGKQPANAEQNAKMANETLAAIREETEAMENDMGPDLNGLMRKNGWVWTWKDWRNVWEKGVCVEWRYKCGYNPSGGWREIPAANISKYGDGFVWENPDVEYRFSISK